MIKVFLPGHILAHLKTLYFRLIIRPSNDLDKNIIYKMVWDRRKILKILNDKYESLKYVRNLIPEVKYAHRYYECTDVASINWNELPANFVCKMSHGSGGVIIVHENAPHDNCLPSNPKKFGWNRLELTPTMFDQARLKNILMNLQKRTYGMGINRSKPEWAYWGITPRVIIEDFLKLEGGMPVRISLNVVHGEVKLFYIDQLFYPELRKPVSLHDRSYTDPINTGLISKDLKIPVKEVEELIQRSILIAHEVDYLRVDWLVSDEGIFFNELTNYCGGGKLKGKSYYPHMSQMWRPRRSDYRQ